MLRFVIQEHVRAEQVHWDLMLEKAGSLVTFQTPQPPQKWCQEPFTGTKICNHRLKYLTYEGPLSGGRGSVQIAAAGWYEPMQITEDYWRVSLQSDKISGKLELKLLQDDRWQLTFHGEYP